METASDVLVATMFGFSTKAKNVGAVTSIDESEGKSLISSEGKVTDERLFASGKQFYFHEHRPTAKTGSEWNLKDELKREYLTSGNQTVTFTPSGWKTNAQKLNTAGEYVWRQETVDPSGPYAGAPVRHWGTSNYHANGFVTQNSLPSGSMSATFDEDGKVVSASGSVSHVNLFSGRAFSHLGGTGHGAKGGEGAAVLVAKREVSRDRLGEFQGSVTHTISPVVNTNSTTGETALAFNEPPPVIAGTKYGYQNEMDKRSVYQIFHGTVTADNNSFLVTDSGDLPEGASSSTNVLLPETDFGVDSSYGNPIADLAPWDGFDVPFTNSATWTGSSGGSGGPQPGDSPLTLGTGNHVDLGMFSSAYDYKGETVGASFAWQLPNTGTPTDPTSFGDAVFNSGNFQSPQEPGGQNPQELSFGVERLSLGQMNDLIKNGLALRVAENFYLIELPGPNGANQKYLYEYHPVHIPLSHNYGTKSTPAHYELRAIGASSNSANTLLDAARGADTVQQLQEAEMVLTFALYVLPGGASADQVGQGKYGAAAISAAEDGLLLIVPILKAAKASNGALRVGATISVVGQSSGAAFTAGQGIYAYANGDNSLAAGKAGETLLRLLGATGAAVELRRLRLADEFASNNTSHNAADFARYKDQLRAEMAKPHVTNQELAEYMNELYRADAKIGSGSTAAAVRHELATGGTVGGRTHSQKARDMIIALQRWLKNNPNASPGDRRAAENVIQDMLNALDGK